MTWNYAYTPYIWPMLISALSSSVIAVYAWRHRATPGAIAFVIQNLANALWALFTAIEIAATSVPIKFVYHKLEGVSAFISISALFYFALARAGVSKGGLRRAVWVISSVNLLCLILVATNHLHHLIWIRLYFDRFTRVDRGPLNFVMVAWVALLPVVASILYIWMAIRSRGGYRWQALLLIAATLLPIATYFLEFMGINPIAPLDPVMLAWNMSGVLYAVAIFRFHMLSVVPVGRHIAIERMADGVLILDAEGQIVDLNPTAESILGLSKKTAIGRKVSRLLASCVDFSSILEQTAPANAEITIQRDGQPRYYQAQSSPLAQPGGFQLGRLILLQDVTEQRRAQQQILEQQRALAMLREREQLARELHDGLGQALAAAHLQASTAKLLLGRGDAAQANECLDDLADATMQAEADMREYLLGVQVLLSPNRSFFAALREYAARFTRQYGLPVELKVPPELEAQALAQTMSLQLLRIVQEGLSNVRKHARARDVEVGFANVDGYLRVTVSDDGQGFNPTAERPDEGFGLRSMRARAEALGGRLELISQPGQGTQVVVEVPVAAEAETLAHGMKVTWIGDGEEAPVEEEYVGAEDD